MIGDMIADSLQISLRYAEMLVVGISPSDFGKLACVDGRKIASNHPAWVYGHLSLYFPRVLEDLGGDAGELQPPAEWDPLFNHQSECQDDTSGSIYPHKDELVECMLRGYREAEQALRNAEDTVFGQPNPNASMANRFSTLGGMENFYTGGHIMIHMGQVSAWRRMMGLGSAS